jgi:hypothetical protein
VVQDSPEPNVLCGLIKDRIIGPFFFMEAAVMGGVYFDMLEQFMYPPVVDFQLNVIYQEDEAASHWSMQI